MAEEKTEKQKRVDEANVKFAEFQKSIKKDLGLDFELVLFYGKSAVVPRAVWSEEVKEEEAPKEEAKEEEKPAEEPKSE